MKNFENLNEFITYVKENTENILDYVCLIIGPYKINDINNYATATTFKNKTNINIFKQVEYLNDCALDGWGNPYVGVGEPLQTIII
ncbi:MAG: hypothetical protein PHX62_04380 [Bacilli bacterium]|jgi:hypothetical protein|nr:hypothetical protein [Bacilli bacterium]